MPKLIATSVVRGSHQGESHGGVYVIDFEKEVVHQAVDWNTVDIDWQGRGWDRGLRGIAFFGERIFVAASDEIFEFNTKLEIVASYKNPYLKHCHEITVHRDHLFITSTAFDSVLALNLQTNQFDMALMVQTDGKVISMAKYNPNGDEGPLPLNKFHLNNITCSEGGMYLSGLKTEGLLFFNGQTIGISATLPKGTHNARPFRDGILFNDTEANAVRYVTPEGKDDAALGVPLYPEDKLTHTEMDNTKIARQGFGRGLCPITDTLIAAGSSPSTVALHDLEKKQTTKSVNISMDIRNAVHGLEVWPFD